MMFSAPTFPPKIDAPLIGNTGGTSVGAIRWDAYHHPTADAVRVAIETSLGPSQYHWRIPFFASEPTANSVTLAGDQSAMDTEIGYAAESGLDYWAFPWNGTSSMMQAWNYFQASPNKNNINWCWIYSPSNLVSEVTNNLAAHVGYLQQTNYQTVLSGRPVIYIFDDNSSQAGLASAITTFRNAATGAGLPNPYFAFMLFGLPSKAQAALISSLGIEALSKYVWAPTGINPQSFTLLDSSNQVMRTEYANLSAECVPTGTIGWDRRPRVENNVPWETQNGTLSDYYFPERMSDISRILDNLLKWVRDNPTKAVANTCLLYAWNEHDEGGWICPTKTATEINRAHLDAIKAVLAP